LGVTKAVLAAIEDQMATRLGIALLGLTCGGVTFLITGLLTFLVINGVEERAVQARAPAAEIGVQYAALPPAAQVAPDESLAQTYPAR
jgi:hypothetical protein